MNLNGGFGSNTFFYYPQKTFFTYTKNFIHEKKESSSFITFFEFTCVSLLGFSVRKV